MVGTVLNTTPQHSQKRRQLALVAAFFVCLPIALTSPAAFAVADSDAINARRLAEVERLAKGGAAQLALQRMDSKQPRYNSDPNEWLRWEKSRIHILEVRRDWQGIVDRLKAAPRRLGRNGQNWRDGRLAAAYLELGDGRSALPLFTGLLRNADSASDDEQESWQRGQVRSYVLLREYDKARELLEQHAPLAAAPKVDPKAAKFEIQRFQDPVTNTASSAANFSELQATVYLLSGRPLTAVEALGQARSQRSQQLRLLAQLRGEAVDPKKALEAALELANNDDLPLRARRNSWLVAMEAAGRARLFGQEASSAEKALALTVKEPFVDEIFSISADDLWKSYGVMAQQAGRTLGLPPGYGDQWFLAAATARDEDELTARAMIAALTFKANNPRDQEIAHRQFAGWMNRDEGLRPLLKTLYLDSERYGAVEKVPKPVRYILVQHAIEASEVNLAAELMGSLDKPPIGSSQLEWLLQRSRVRILAGLHSAGLKDLQAVLDTEGGVNSGTYNGILAVLFDVQNVDRHKDALSFFKQLQAYQLDPIEQRELWYWMAESSNALEDYAAAGLYYLRSATEVDPFAMDPWAKTARFNAAEALAKAGFVQDARVIYQGLFAATTDQGRKNLLRHKLQQLESRTQ